MASIPDRIVLDVALFTAAVSPFCAQAGSAVEPAANEVAQGQPPDRWPPPASSLFLRQAPAPDALSARLEAITAGELRSAKERRPMFHESPSVWKEWRDLTGCVPSRRNGGFGVTCRFTFGP